VEEDAAGHTLRLLSIDDNADSAELVARIARRCGCDARVASTPGEIREALKVFQPEILALDLSMPELDGLDLLRLLQDVGYKGRLIIISGHDDFMRASAGRLATARGLELIGNLQKPLDGSRLRELLGTLRPSR
jgi:DNA-binding NtrC family response regulator